MVLGNQVMAPMLTVRDVAHILHVHINTVRRWSDQGIIKSYRIACRGDRRFSQDNIAGFLSGLNHADVLRR